MDCKFSPQGPSLPAAGAVSMAWKRQKQRRDEGALAPNVEWLMSLARSAESRPRQGWYASGSHGDGWSAGRAAWPSTKCHRSWDETSSRWSGWGRNAKLIYSDGGWKHATWQWNDWDSRNFVEEAGAHAAGRKSDCHGIGGSWQTAWSWDDYIVIKGSTVRVELSGAELGDSDLAVLVRHLDSLMQRHSERTDGKYVLNIDLSCNLYISDDGIIDHLAPFLHRWPVCHRLKLYKTSIGDGALGSLSTWAAGGYAHELHLSDLGGQVTGDAVFSFLKEVHQKGKYPYRNNDGVRCALWLRLEHNAVPGTDKLVSKAQSQGMSLSVLQKPDLGQVRPGTPSIQCAKDVPAVNLVLFHKQELRVCRQWIGSMVPMAPIPEELQRLIGSSYGSASDASSEGKSNVPLSLAKFLGPSQREVKHAPGSSGANMDAYGARGAAGVEAGSRGTFEAAAACPAGMDDEVLRRWRWHLQGTSGRILPVAAGACGARGLDKGPPGLLTAAPLAAAPQMAVPLGAVPLATAPPPGRALQPDAPPQASLQPAAALSASTAASTPSEPASSESSGCLAREPEDEHSSEDAAMPLDVGPPVPPPPALALVAAPCA
mmetsp:Transcript_61757/g.199080  ORF Transcript_61757/g.199080 Transcript_61757/m.199080 type:complete len:600 (-) Transcript_61757:192-1991(-)